MMWALGMEGMEPGKADGWVGSDILVSLQESKNVWCSIWEDKYRKAVILTLPLWWMCVLTTLWGRAY